MRYQMLKIIRLLVGFYAQVKYSKSNINDHYRIAIWDPSVRDFAIVRKTPVHFGNSRTVRQQQTGGTYIVTIDKRPKDFGPPQFLNLSELIPL